MSEMIERVARALAEATDTAMKADDKVIIDNSGVAVAYWTLFIRQAQVVIESMREPIIDALKPFADCAEELDGSDDTPRAPDGEWAKFRLLTDDYRRARDVVAMIDAALK